MAINYSVQGALSGRLGNMIGYRMFGRNYLRSMPAHYHDRRSAPQLAQRSRFKAMVSMAAQARSAVLVGLRAKAAELGMTPYNAFAVLNHHLFRSDSASTSVSIDYSRLQFSAGAGAPVFFHTPEVDADGVLTLRFEKALNLPRSGNTDLVHVFLYNPASGRGCAIKPVERRTKVVRALIPAWLGEGPLHIYGFTQTPDGQCSATVYAGLPSGSVASLLDQADSISTSVSPVTVSINSPADGPQAATDGNPPGNIPPKTLL